jgi:hypothetical protein
VMHRAKEAASGGAARRVPAGTSRGLAHPVLLLLNR